MSQDFFATVPVSEPSPDGFTRTHSDMGGFGWDPEQGLFIPSVGEVSMFQTPNTAVGILRNSR